MAPHTAFDTIWGNCVGYIIGYRFCIFYLYKGCIDLFDQFLIVCTARIYLYNIIPAIVIYNMFASIITDVTDRAVCIKWADEESIIRIILNTYDYVKEYIDPNAPGGKEHIGYIVDRTGFEEFKRWAMKDVVLPDIAEVYTPVYWKGVQY